MRGIRWPLPGRQLPRLLFDRVDGRSPWPSALSWSAIRRIVEEALVNLDGGRLRSVGITVGSRGIRQVVPLIECIRTALSERGIAVHLIPAMGSHGGGTPEGRAAVLMGLGFRPPFLDSPHHVEPLPGVVWTEAASRVDTVLLVNRVKPHTSFHGPIESGLVKMLVVGLGGPEGARRFHARPQAELATALIELGQRYLQTGKVLGGFAVVERPDGEITHLAFLPPERLLAEEAKLLRLARTLLPRLPFRQADVLIVGRMGKNLSGTGLDTNVIGRTGVPGFVIPDAPVIERIVVLDLTDESHGNANGVGLADVITRRLYRKIDAGATYLNCLTSTFLERGRLPLVMPNARTAILAAIVSLPERKPLRVAYVEDTLHPEDAYVSRGTAFYGTASGPFRLCFRGADVRFVPTLPPKGESR